MIHSADNRRLYCFRLSPRKRSSAWPTALFLQRPNGDPGWVPGSDVRSHSPTKAAGDPFADGYNKKLVAAWPRAPADDKRTLFVVSAFSRPRALTAWLSCYALGNPSDGVPSPNCTTYCWMQGPCTLAWPPTKHGKHTPQSRRL